jgi:hypothetical protein
MADPRGPGPLTKGNGGHLERGTVISVDAGNHVYYVALNSGRAMHMSRIRSHPGDMVLLPIRTQVIVTWALGLPYIMGVLPSEVAADTTETPQAITDVPGHGGQDPVLQRNMGAVARAPTEPNDILPGDYNGMSPDGAAVSALHGKVAQLRGGPMAKVQAFGETDRVKIVTGIFDFISWMGEAKIINNGGKTSYVWRGGTDQITQTGPDEEKYTIWLDVGHTGDVILLQVKNRQKQVVFRFHVSASGACEIFAAGGMNQHGGGAASDVNPTRIHGSRETEVAGASVERVSGNSTHTCEGTHRRNISGDDNRNIGGGQSIYVTSDHQLQVSGNSDETIAGTKTVTGIEGITHEVLADGTYAVNTQLGNIVFTTAAGKFQVRSAVPGSIELGIDPTSHVVKFEELQSVMMSFKAQLDLMFQMIRNHTHAIGPSGITPSVELVAGLSAPLNFDMYAAKSLMTKTT